MSSTPAEQAPLAYRIRDAERVSGLSKSRLYELAAEGQIRLCKIGRRTLIPAVDLRRIIESGCQRAA